MYNYLSDGVQEEVLLSIFGLLDQAEYLIKEEVRISDCDVS